MRPRRRYEFDIAFTKKTVAKYFKGYDDDIAAVMCSKKDKITDIRVAGNLLPSFEILCLVNNI